MSADTVSDGANFFGISSGASSTGAPGTGSQGVADPSSAIAKAGGYGDQYQGTTGADHVGTARPVDTSANDDGGPAHATNPGYYLSSQGTHTPDVQGTSATTNGSPNGDLPYGHTESSTGASGSGRVSHNHYGS